MNQSVDVVGLYVRDQDEALAFYVGKLGFQLYADARNGGREIGRASCRERV